MLPNSTEALRPRVMEHGLAGFADCAAAFILHNSPLITGFAAAWVHVIRRGKIGGAAAFPPSQLLSHG